VQFVDPRANDVFPAGQAAQLLAPANALYEPIEQSVHNCELSAEAKEPAGHDEHEVPLTMVPVGQKHVSKSPAVPFETVGLLHAHVEGSCGPVPAAEEEAGSGHARHAIDVALKYEPAAHASHEVDPGNHDDVPASQGVHAVLLNEPANVPAGHTWQVGELSAVEKVPGAHAVQGEDALMAMPAGHGGPVLAVHVSESPDPLVIKDDPHAQFAGAFAAVPAVEFAFGGQGTHAF
jgi:hypothetical protein